MKECKHLVKYIRCAECGSNIHNVTIIKTKAEERLIKAALAFDEDTENNISGSSPFNNAAKAVRKERAKK